MLEGKVSVEAFEGYRFYLFKSEEVTNKSPDSNKQNIIWFNMNEPTHKETYELDLMVRKYNNKGLLQQRLSPSI